MATARKLPSGNWNCQVYSHTEQITNPDGTTKEKRVYKSFTCDIPGPKGKRECERMAAEWAAEKERHQKCNLTFGDALDRFLSSRKSVLSPSTMRGYLCDAKHLAPLRGIRLDRLTQDHIQQLVGDLSLNHSPKTVSNIHGLISAVLRLYRPDFQIQTKLPAKERPNLTIPTDADIAALLDYVRGHSPEMELPILLAAFGPMRRGEICALEKSDISENVVHVCRAIVETPENTLQIKTPKTYAGDRYISFPDFVRTKWESVETNRLVQLTPSAISNRFFHIVKNAGVPHFRFHDLRHYSASIQHALGVPDAYIMARGGWENDSTLKSIYRHAMSDQTMRMNQVINSHFAEIAGNAAGAMQDEMQDEI